MLDLVEGWILGSTYWIGESDVSPRRQGRDTWGVAVDRFHRHWKKMGRLSQFVVG